MDLKAPESFSPSSLSQFASCPLAFRYSYIERRPSPPQLPATRGSIVHRALELLFNRNPQDRGIENCLKDLELALSEYEKLPDLIDLDLDEKAYEQLVQDCKSLVNKYFEIENPMTINPIGLEVKLQAQISKTTIRGIIDRLEIGEQGELVVTDYKTGSAPRSDLEASKLSGVNLYALLCQQIFGQLPSKVQLIYLTKPVIIISKPTDSIIRGVQQRSNAIHTAVENACVKNDFRPNPSALCSWCAFQKLCPQFGGKIPND